jgi:CDP-diacylglycerol--serine O-phosphatidyltransferase
VKRRLKYVPNAITAGNMFCGFLAIIKTMQGDFIAASWLILLAAVLDALDGKVARFTGNQSKFGIEFDSFSDIVSFGVAPSILVYKLYFNELGTIGIFLSFLLIFAGAARLARFNIQTSLSSAKKLFRGLPIPVSAITIISFVIFSNQIWDEITHKKYLILIVVLLSFLMVSSIKYSVLPAISLKKGFKNSFGLLVLTIFTILAFLFKGLILFPACVLFILSGIIKKVFRISDNDEKVAELELTE